MILYEQPLFWLLIIAGIVAVRLLPAGRWLQLKAGLIGGVNLLGLFALFKLSPVWLAAFVAGSLGLSFALAKSRAEGSITSIGTSMLLVFPLFLMWILGKQASVLGWAPLKYLSFVGFSYLLIKVWTLIRDAHTRPKQPINVWVTFAYLFYFPTYLMGPMHYYQEFEETLNNPYPLNAETVIDSLYRILLGLLKIKWFAALLMPISLVALQHSPTLSLKQLLVGCLVYSFVILLDFSGACDIVIGTSRLIGINVPENFNYPYWAKDIREFWQRWHITFSRVLTQYIFIPVSRALQTRWKDKPNKVMLWSYLITFLFCGFWHHPSLHFVVWGLYHGIGLALFDFWRKRQLKQRLQHRKEGKEFKEIPAWLKDNMGRALTFVFVSIGWIFFVLPLAKLSLLFAR